METRYAKKDVYAEVEEEGGKVNRLVATAGEPIPVAYAGYVKDSDTTTGPPAAAAGLTTADRSAAARRAKPSVNDAEGTVDHEESREQATLGGLQPPAPGSTEVAGGQPQEEPLEGYSELTVDQVLERLPDLDPDQVAAVQAYEAASSRESKKIAAYQPAPAGA